MAPKKALLVMMDETDIHLCPDLKTKGLQPLGQQAKIAGPGLDQVCYLFGSTDPGGKVFMKFMTRKPLVNSVFIWNT